MFSVSLRKDEKFLPVAQIILVPSTFLGFGLALYFHGISASYWIFPLITMFYMLLELRRAAIANGLLLLLIFVVFLGDIDRSMLVRMITSIVWINFFVAAFVVTIERQQVQLRSAAITDALTGLLNRATLHQSLEDAIQQNRRSKISMTLLAIDLDHFKRINDEYGHDGGDQVLRSFSALLKSRFRRTDKIFRNGGEEFLVLLFDTGREGAISIAEHLLQDLRVFQGLMTTASIGAAEYRHGELQDTWVKRADDCLYEAKRSGRNQVVS